MKINRFVFWGISLFLSLLMSYLNIASLKESLLDQDIVNSLNLLQDQGDFARVLAKSKSSSIRLGIIHIVFHFLFLFFCTIKLKDKKIILSDFLVNKNDGIILVAIRLIGYVQIYIFIKSYIITYYKFLIFDFLFTLITIIVIGFYVIWITSINKELSDWFRKKFNWFPA